MTALTAFFIYVGRLRRWQGYLLLALYVAYWIVSSTALRGTSGRNGLTVTGRHPPPHGEAGHRPCPRPAPGRHRWLPLRTSPGGRPGDDVDAPGHFSIPRGAEITAGHRAEADPSQSRHALSRSLWHSAVGGLLPPVGLLALGPAHTHRSCSGHGELEHDGQSQVSHVLLRPALSRPVQVRGSSPRPGFATWGARRGHTIGSSSGPYSTRHSLECGSRFRWRALSLAGCRWWRIRGAGPRRRPGRRSVRRTGPAARG